MSVEALNVLIVDDDDVDRERIRRMLRSSDPSAKISEAATADESIACIKNCHYDCVIVDYRLGKTDGLLLMSEIRNISLKKTAVIMVTGLGDEGVAAQALRGGASDYITKSQLQSPLLMRAIISAVHRVELERKLHEMAHYDALTGVASRPLLLDRLRQVIAGSSRTEKIAAVAFLDLDNFKPVNDVYGHEAGDFVLVEIARRLQSMLRIDDTVARLGGDEFVLLLLGLESAQECELLLRRVLSAIVNSIELPSGHEVRVSASIGITLITDASVEAETVLRHADQTMYKVKNSGRCNIQFFDPTEERKQSQRRGILQDVKAGLSRGEFELYYQPQVNLFDRRIIGVEALIRWNLPQGRVMPPVYFIDVLNHPILGATLGEWVIKTAMEQLCVWHAQGLPLTLSINISAPHLQRTDFIDRLSSLLVSVPTLPASSIELEVLETVSMADMRDMVKILGRCRDMGFSIALDDFGTGYASLSYLKKLPLDTIKVDRSFVKNMQRSRDDRAIIESMVGLSRAFGYRLIAEGVETKEHQALLMSLGCQLGQGYSFSRPIPAAQIATWIKDGGWL